MASANVASPVELWKDVPGYEGFYQVSSLGRVKSLARSFYAGKTYKSFRELPEFIKQTNLNGDGYECCAVTEPNGRPKKQKIHRLVALAFIPNPDNKECIDHINGIRNDNRVENLRWVTRKENMNNLITLSNLSKSHIGVEQNRKIKVEQIDPTTGVVLAVHKNGRAASRSVNGCPSWINKACKSGKVAHGFIWRYAQ